MMDEVVFIGRLRPGCRRLQVLSRVTENGLLQKSPEVLKEKEKSGDRGEIDKVKYDSSPKKKSWTLNTFRSHMERKEVDFS